MFYCFVAITSLRGALWSFFRNILAVGFLYGFCYGAMLVSVNTKVVGITYDNLCCSMNISDGLISQ